MRKQSRALTGLIAAGLVSVAAALTASPAWADLASDDPVRACDRAAVRAEAEWKLPAGILAAIATVESGRGGTGSARPVAWPWSINAGGRGYFLPSKDAAVLTVQALKSGGQRIIDVGCFQVNLFYHPEAFATLDVAFDPEINAQAAARILTRSQGAGGSWEGSIALYHSATPVLGANYLRQVQAVWPWAKTRSAMSAEIGPDAYAALLSPAARQVRVLSGREVTQPGALPMPRVVDWPGTSPACSGMKSIACMPRVVDWPGTLPVPASAPAPSMVSHPSAPVATPVAAAPVAPVVATPVAAGDCIVGASSGRQTRRCGRGDRRGDRLEPAADWRGTRPLSPVGRSLQMTR